jgi:hypothetical protein
VLLFRPSAKQGTCFAWLPKRTPDGLVWLETVRFEFNDSEFGSWHYRRLPKVSNRKPDYYLTPPHWSGCKNFNKTGPTPCWHPHCDCFALFELDDGLYIGTGLPDAQIYKVPHNQADRYRAAKNG